MRRLTVVSGLTAVVVSAYLVLAARCDGQPHPAPQANLIRIEGHVGPPAPKEKGSTALVLQADRKEYRFQTTRLRVLTGSRQASTILNEVAAYRPQFFLRGAETMVQRLAAATPADRVHIVAYYRPGSRDLMVSEITLIGPRSTAASTSTPTPRP